MSEKKYIPALRFHWMTNHYDWLASAFLPEKKFKTELLSHAGITNGHHILDFGTGTATLSIMAKQMHPDIQITGLDVDTKILGLAEKKIKNAKVSVDLRYYDGKTFPFQDASFHRVISSLVFHHLEKKQKLNALAEIKRVLVKDGELHIADWGKPSSILMRTLMFSEQWLDGYQNTIDNIKGRLPVILEEAGFSEVREIKKYDTVLGTIRLLKAVKR